MNQKTRAELIRKGNQAFNSGKYEFAIKIFNATNYADGLNRIGDLFFFDRHQPLVAYGYYRKAKNQKMINKIFDGFTFALKCWLSDEKKPANDADEAIAPKPLAIATDESEFVSDDDFLD